MKYALRLYVVLISIVIIQSCGSDDSRDLNQSQLMINFSENYLPEGQSGHVYLTDESGTLISESPIQNGLSVILSANFGLPDKRFDLTIVREITFLDGFNSKAATTYIDVAPSTIDLDIISATEFGGNATVVIQDTGTALEDICCFSGRGTISPNQAELHINMRAGNDIYLVIQNETESFKRYFLERGVADNYTRTLQYSELEILDNPTGITIPSSDRFLSKIEGNFSHNPNTDDLTISSVSSDGPLGETLSMHFIPENTFTISKVEHIITVGSKTYGIEDFSNTIPQNVTLPNFDLNVTEASMDNFTASTTGSFDYYTLGFRFINDYFLLTWGVVGASDELSNVSVPTAVGEVIQSQFSDFSIHKLDFFAGQLTNYSGSPTLEEVLEGKRHDRIEYVSKTY